MICRGCGLEEDVRFGVCFDCATSGEARAAKRTVLQHIRKGFGNAMKRKWISSRIDFMWAWERLTRTGDYAPGGTFERDYGIRA